MSFLKILNCCSDLYRDQGEININKLKFGNFSKVSEFEEEIETLNHKFPETKKELQKKIKENKHLPREANKNTLKGIKDPTVSNSDFKEKQLNNNSFSLCCASSVKDNSFLSLPQTNKDMKDYKMREDKDLLQNLEIIKADLLKKLEEIKLCTKEKRQFYQELVTGSRSLSLVKDNKRNIEQKKNLLAQYSQEYQDKIKKLNSQKVICERINHNKRIVQLLNERIS